MLRRSWSAAPTPAIIMNLRLHCKRLGQNVFVRLQRDGRRAGLIFLRKNQAKGDEARHSQPSICALLDSG